MDQAGLIRPALASDAEAIAGVMVASWRSTYAGLIDQAFLDRLEVPDQAARWHGTITRHAHSSCVFVALDEGGRVCGFASGGRERDLDQVHLGELYSLYLLAGEQGQGRGRRLVGAVAGWLHQHRMDSMLVWVLRDNGRARGFYEHLGGAYLRGTMRRLFELEFPEVSYGWTDTAALR